jgi:hypothetical protein
MTNYPSDVMVLYAEGYSVTNFLVTSGGRKTFLDFVGQGMRGDWDAAVKACYGYKTVEELEQAWLQFLQNNKAEAAGQVVSGRTGAESDANSRVTLRQTVPPAQPLLDGKPVVRGQIPDADPAFDARAQQGRPAFLPEYHPPAGTAPTGVPVSFPAPKPPPPSTGTPARLGVPMMEVPATPPPPPAPPQLHAPIVAPVSPVGYPN